MKLNTVFILFYGETMKNKFTILGLLTIGLIPQAAPSLPTMKELLGRLQTTQLSQITGKQALPWVGGAGIFGASYLGLNWYKKYIQNKDRTAAEAKKDLFERKFAYVMQHENVKNDYAAALISAINDFTQFPDDKRKAEYADYAYDKVMAAHFADEKNNPSPLEIINTPLSTKLTPLMSAVSNANVNAVKWLLKKGANPLANVSGDGWQTAAQLTEFLTANNPTFKAKYIQIKTLIDSEKLIKATIYDPFCKESEIQTLNFAMQCRAYYNKIL